MPQTVHVYPNNDLIEHDTDGGDCPCPTSGLFRCGRGVWMGHHASQPDGREANEPEVV